MTRIAQDLRQAVRSLRAGRGHTVLAIGAFALGIGATTAVFSIFSGVLLTPLPFPEPDRLVMVYDTQPACSTCPASYPKYDDWKQRNRVFAAIGGSTPAPMVMTGRGEPQRVGGIATTASLADVFGVRPALGRWYSEEEDRPGGPKVVVLSHGFWLRTFEAAPGALGAALMLDGEPHEIIGIMPDHFTHRNGAVYVPLARPLDPATRGTHFLATYARLADGVTLERATTEMRALGHALAAEFGHNHGIDVRSYHEVVVGDIRTPLRVLLGAVFLVLLIACANVANLLLASGLARRREFAIRVALGAGSRDLARQLTTEAVLLAAAGGALGILLALWGTRTFVGLAANVLPRASTIAIDARVVAFTAVVSVLVGIACGLWPLARLRTGELAAAVREGDTRTGSGAGRAFGNGLVTAEIAIAFALLTGAGLLVKNLLLLERRDTGVRTERVLAFDVAPGGPRYQDPARVGAFYRELLDRLATMGGVQSVGATSHLPMYRYGTNGEMTIEGGTPWGPGEAPLVEYRWVAGDLFRTLGIPLLKGRLFDERDTEASGRVAVINQRMADTFWPGQDPLGKRFGQGGDPARWEVIGVVGNTRAFGLTREMPYEMYQTIEQEPFSAMTVVMRTEGASPQLAVQGARGILHQIDPGLPVSSVQTMEQVVSASAREPRLLSALTAVFGALAGLLAIVGIYGVTAYNVRRQRREFGIHLALGADPGAVRALVVRRGLAVAAAGVAAGAVAAFLLTRAIGVMLHDVRPADPTVFALNVILVFGISLVACYLPARSAGRTDPLIVLRDG